jgi:hypothetical protein
VKTAHLIDTLTAAYSGIRTCSVENFAKMKAVLANMPNRELEAIADSDARFVNTAANSVLVDRGVRTLDHKIDHAARVIAKSIHAETIGGAA